MDSPPRPGSAILLAVGGQIWRTALWRVEEDSLLLSLGEIPPVELLRLDSGLKVSCRYHESQVLCTFDSSVRGHGLEDGQHLLEVATPPQVSRNHRRRHLRVVRHVPLKLRLPLRNDALTKLRGKDFIQLCWIEAVAVNISAGGLRAVLSLPRHHSVAQHPEAKVRLELGGEVLHDRRLTYVRRDWSTDDVVLVYAFADLSHEEAERIEGYNLSWLNQNSQGGSQDAE